MSTRGEIGATHATDSVVIVGAGFGGLAMGYRLKEAGIHDFVIVDEGDEVGGTWRDNRYPGAACDVPSHLYSFSFALNPEWTRAYAGQEEIQRYLVRCADAFGLRPHLRLGTRIESARYDAGSGTWTLRTRRGERLTARVVVSACGGLSRPVLPSIPGLETFEGPAMHSARWRDDVAVEGRTVAVIGTGASAIQIIPSLAPRVAKLLVFQRTPSWILPKPDGPISSWKRAAYKRVPVLQRLARLAQYWRAETMATAFVYAPLLLKLGELQARRHLTRSVPDPLLRSKLLPRYAMGCKRIVPTSDFYPALTRANVELVTDTIDSIGPRSIVTTGGIERPTDVLILATGFRASEQVAPFEIVGLGDRRLDRQWEPGAQAYLGTTVSGFPNLFFLVGPNTGLGHNSLVFMIESQVRYVVDAIRTMRGLDLASVEVLAEEQARFNDLLSERLPKTVWATGCRSWYQTADGKNTTLWPGFTFEFRMRTRRFDAHRYELRRKWSLRVAPETETEAE